MNARRFFKDCLVLDAQEAADFIKQEFGKLQAVIFSIMPDRCFLKGWRVLDMRMVFMLSPEMIEKKLISQKDVCALCSAKDCPFNKVDYKDLRVMKVKFLGRFYNQ